MSKKNKPQTNKPAPQTRSIHEGVPREVAQRIDQEKPTRFVQSSFEGYSGPIPHPVLLKGYEDILPGATDRIISMAENQSQHRHDMEKTVISMESRNSLLGLIFGFLMGMTCVLGGAVCILFGEPWGGGFLGTAGLSGLVGVFVYGSRERRRERESVQARQKDSEAEK